MSRAGRIETCFSCALLVVLLGVAATWHLVEGDPGRLPAWARVALPLAALALLAAAYASEGGGIARDLDPGPPAPPRADAPPDDPAAPPPARP